MATLGTTTMSSKGQVVIPESIRLKLGLQTGTQFIILGEDDVVVLKPINMPAMEEFGSIIGQVREEARQAGLTKTDIASAIKAVRKRKKSPECR